MRTTSAAMSGVVVGQPGVPRLRTVVRLGDEFAIPAQDRVGCHDGGDRREVTTAENVTLHGEAASLIVGQAQSPRTVHGAEDTVLLEQVFNDRLLMAVDPASEQQKAKRERARRPVHRRELA
jgi:hypothetical protein